MSIASKLEKLQTDIANAYDSIETKGGTMPQNKNTENLAIAISSISGGGSSINIFIQDTQPSGYDGIWIADSTYSDLSIVEVENMSSIVSHSINITKSNNQYTTLLTNSFEYIFGEIYITDSNNKIIYGVSVYYGDGTQWVDITIQNPFKDYLQSSGTQYIDTGISFDNNTKIVGVFSYISKQNSTNNNQNAILGIGTMYQTSGYMGVVAPASTSNIQVYCGNQYSDVNISYNTNKHEFEVAGTNAGNVRKLDSTSGTVSSVGYPRNIYIYAMNESNGVHHYAIARVYSFKIYKSGSLVRDFVPALDDNQVACMYDKITEAFYYNKGTGSFIAGDET